MRSCLNCLESIKVGKLYICTLEKIDITHECEAWKKGLGRGTDCEYWNMIDADGEHLWKDDVSRDDYLYDDNAAQQCEQGAVEEIHSRS